MLALALVWVAAPALSSQRYVPGAVDFEQPLPALHASAKTQDKSYLSPVVTAPQRFDLAGIARERRAYEVRGREAGGEWSPWVEAEDGNPVYFGGADELQVRARGWRPRGTLHYVNVSGTT